MVVRNVTRAATARNYQSREAGMRKLFEQQERGILWTPEPPPGMHYGWIRRAVRNEEDSLNMQQASMSGWKAVPASRHPERAGIGALGMPTKAQHEYIEVGGLLMCEIPLEVLEAHEELQKMQAYDAVKMPHIQDLGDQRANPDLPMWSRTKTGFERVISEKVADDGDEEFKE